MSAFKEALLELMAASRAEGIAIAVAKDDVYAEACARRAEAMTALLDLVPTELLRSDD